MIVHGLLERVTSALRQGRRPDYALAGALTAVGQAEAWLADTVRPTWMHALVALAITASLAWRRRYPLPVLAVAIAGTFVLEADELSLFAAIVIAAYTTGAELEGRRAWAGLLLAVLPFWAAFATVADGVPSDFVAIAVLYGGAWSVGRVVRERGERAEHLAQRAAWLEQQQGARAEAAVAAERARIARELHDVISHSISVIAIQTQAIRRRLDPAHAHEADALRALEVTARDAMSEMRRLFGVLRTDGEPAALAPQPGLHQLEELVERARGTGLKVDVRVEGAWTHLPPGINLAAYRIVQEALTNTLKHAHASRATVDVRVENETLELAVVDDGVGIRPLNGAGHGIVGMRERVLLYGGELDVREVEPSGVRVRAILPLGEVGLR